MTKLPKTIIVVAIKHSNKYSNLRKICREFLEGIPHIVYTDYNLDSNDIYYIFAAGHLIKSFIFMIYDEINIPNILGYGEYDYTEILSLIWPTYVMCSYTYTYNLQWLPPTIKIDTNDIKKLELLTED